MSIHVPTLLAALVVGYLTLTLQLAVVHPGVRSQPGMRRWVAGSWVILLGFAMLGARLVLPLMLSVVLGNGLIALGLGLYHQAIQQHLGRVPPQWPLWVQAPIWLLLLVVGSGSVPHIWRTAVVSCIDVSLAIPTLVLLLRHGWRAERSLRTVTITLGVAAGALVLRSIDSVLNPQDYRDLLQPSLGQGLTFLAAFIGLLGTGFGFVLAVFERVANRMQDMASHDGLTGCLNRSTCDALLEHALARSRREGSVLAFVLMDLDHFKQVNDRHGHRKGDEVLRRFADAARQRLRRADVLGRTGGEEFGLVLPGTDAAGAMRLVEEVRQATEALALTGADGRPMVVTVSAGVAVAMPGDEVSADRLYGWADQALYEAKHAGRNRVELFGDLNRRQGTLLSDMGDGLSSPSVQARG